jgi:hypothetical protein
MNTVNALQLTENRVQDFGLFLAEFALEFVPAGEDVNTYDANDFMTLFDAWYQNFIQYAETNRLFAIGEKEALLENDNELDCLIKDAAIDAAREIITVKK